MIDKIINFLQWIKSNDVLRRRLDFFISFLFIFLSASLAWNFYKDISYCYGDCGRGIIELILLGFFYIAIVVSLCYAVWRKIRMSSYSVVRLILNNSLPFFVGLILVSFYSKGDNYSSLGWYIYFFGGLYALSPISSFLLYMSKEGGLLRKFLSFYKRYIISFLIALAGFLFFFILRESLGGFRYAEFTEIAIMLSVIIFVFVLGAGFILAYAWDEIGLVDDSTDRSIRKLSIGLLIIFLFTWLSPNWKEVFIENRVTTAQNIFSKKGYAEDAYKDVSKIWGLEWSLKERFIKERSSAYDDLYSKIFDRSIESSIDKKVDTDRYRSWNSNATSLLARGENAKVNLNFAKHESEILSDIGAIKTTITYEFQNTTSTNQEVVYSIMLPDANSVMYELKLGLDLQYQGIIAPRGAASKVYQDSLRRNTDPALLEQTGPVTYRLRVFPVPSVQDSNTKGKQKVQFSYISPFSDGDNITLIPKTDILNLKLTESSDVFFRVLEGDKSLIQDSEKGDNMTILTDGKKEKLDISGVKDWISFCSANTYDSSIVNIPVNVLSPEKKYSKNIIFLDISKSMEEKKNIRKKYQSLIDTWKKEGISLDIYGFNTDISSLSYDISDLKFWGNTDTAKIIKKISKESMENANIVIITDDDSYEAIENVTTEELKNLGSNRISLVQVGEKIRSIKTELTRGIVATSGDVIILGEDAPIPTQIKDIFSPKTETRECQEYTGDHKKSLGVLQGYNDSRKILGMSNVLGDVKSLEAQEYISKTTQGVNQSTSLIALENDRQKADLERYSAQSGKYDTTYENFDNTSSPDRTFSRSELLFNDSVSLRGGASSSKLNFGVSKASDLRGASAGTGWGERGSNSTTFYIFLILLFPVVSWYILRKKKSTGKDSSVKE